jgi:hypothetical protein
MVLHQLPTVAGPGGSEFSMHAADALLTWPRRQTSSRTYAWTGSPDSPPFLHAEDADPWQQACGHQRSYINVDEYGFSNPFDLRDDTFEIECLREHNLEDLLYVDRRGSRTEDQ